MHLNIQYPFTLVHPRASILTYSVYNPKIQLGRYFSLDCRFPAARLFLQNRYIATVELRYFKAPTVAR